MAVKKKRNNNGIVIIKKANSLIEARYRFDIWETRIFLSVLSQIQMDDDDLVPYRIRFSDVKKKFGLKSNQSYSYLRQAAKDLMQKTFNISYIDPSGVMRERAYNIIRFADYLKEGSEDNIKNIDKHEYIDIQIEGQLKPLLIQLQKNFTAYDLQNVVKLGAQPIRLYELLKQYETIGHRKLEIDYLRRVLEFDQEYQKFADFFRYFVEPAIKDINEKTDLTVTSLEKIKEGRNIVAFLIHFKRKPEEELIKMRGETNKQIPLFSEVEMSGDNLPVSRPLEARDLPVIESLTIGGNNNVDHLDWFPKLNDWWGVQKTEFIKRASGKSEQDIQLAIEFTKTQIKAGKAANPAGVFLKALSEGYVTPDQQKAIKKQTALEKKRLLESKLKEHQETDEAYIKAINDMIRVIVEEYPSATENAMQSIKATHLLLGDRTIKDKQIEDFRNDPVLRAQVKTEIIKAHADRFSTINQSYGDRLALLEAEIAALKVG